MTPERYESLLMFSLWRRLTTRLGLSRAGRWVFTAAAVLGFGLAVADDVLPRSGSEADLGPIAAGVVGFYTILMLGFVTVVDRSFQAIARVVSQSRSGK
jgi:hypothetical protein